MDRRSFLKHAALWSAGALMSVPVFDISAQEPIVSGSSKLSVVRGTDYAALVVKSLEPLGGMAAFVKPGNRVVIKPNIGWDRSPEQAANTHPLVVKALVEQALAAGASEVRIFDRTCNEDRRCYVNSGIQPLLESLQQSKVKVEFMDDRKYVPIDLKKGKSLTRWEFYKDALDADCYINVPVAKHHGLTKLSLGLKNTMGILGGNRGKLHHYIDQKLADIATVFRPTLTVIDATRLLMRNGPQGGSIDDVKVTNTVLASIDPVAIDAYATTLFDMTPDSIETTVAAHRLGLGEIDLTKVTIIQSTV